MSADSIFLAFAQETRPRLEQQLEHVLRRHTANAKTKNAPYAELLRELAILISRGGKRLRPLLYLLAYEAYGGRRKSAPLQLAVSLELLHAFFLIHDDIIDQDCQRWGGANIIGVYFERFGSRMPPREAMQTAQSWALLAGDSCLNIAYSLLASSGFESDIVLSMLPLVERTVTDVIAGELADTAYGLPSALPTAEQILTMYRHKTASYSFGLPLQLAAITTGQTTSETAVLQTIADNLGIAFQLQDDLLGTFGIERRTGKSIASDIREGKHTLLVALALKQASVFEQRELQGLLGKQTITDHELIRARAILAHSGAQAAVSTMVREYSARALAAVADSNMNKMGQQRLRALTNWLTDRDQ